MTLAAAMAMAAATAACGGTAGVTVDAGPVDGRADTPAPDTGPTGCDPVAQTCGAAQKCDFGCAGATAVVGCWPSTSGGTVGSPCSSAMPCAAGTGCVTVAGTAAACRKYCAGDGDCASGERCHNDTVGVACGGPATSLALHFCH
jgi:hypothetical protein